MALKYLGHETRQLGQPTSWKRTGPPVNELGVAEVEVLSSNPAGNTDSPYWGFLWISSVHSDKERYGTSSLGYDRHLQRPV